MPRRDACKDAGGEVARGESDGFEGRPRSGRGRCDMGMTSTLAIYTDHFGLNERPFTLLPDPDFLYWSEIHTRAYAMLEYGMLTHAPITVITGEIGAGKTTLLRHLLADAARGVHRRADLQRARQPRRAFALGVDGARGADRDPGLLRAALRPVPGLPDRGVRLRAAHHADLRRGAEPLDRDARGAPDVLQHQRRQGRADPAGAGRPAGAARADQPAAADAVRAAGVG